MGMSRNAEASMDAGPPAARTPRSGARRVHNWPLFVLFCAAVVVPALLVAFAAYSSYRQAESEAYVRAERAAESLRGHALQLFRAQELTIGLLRTFMPNVNWQNETELEQVKERLRGVVSEIGDLSSVHFASGDGLRTVSNRGVRRVDVRERDYFKAVRDGAERFISAPSVGPASGLRIFGMSGRLVDADGGFAGVVVVSVDQAALERFYIKLLESPDTDSVGLVRSDGTVLVRAPGLTHPATLPASSGLLKGIRHSPESGRFKSVAVVDGIERLYVYKKVDKYPAYVSYAVSTATIWKRWREDMKYFVIIGAGASLLLLLTAYVALRTTRRADRADVQLAVEAGHRAAADAARVETERAVRSRDAFIATLSHELRNPLAAVSTCVALARRQLADPPAAADALDVATRQIGRLKRMLEDLLDVARISKGRVELRMQAFDVVEFVERVCADHFPDAADRLSVTGGTTPIEADPVRLEQMLVNLVDNAFKYGARQVTIDVEVRGESIVVAVRDDGQGFPAGHVDSLTDLAELGDRSTSNGLGLGLSIVSSLAALHGGRVEATSDGPGRGATFTLTLPRSGRHAPHD
jgi:signal transduction histidine kinase